MGAVQEKDGAAARRAVEGYVPSEYEPTKNPYLSPSGKHRFFRLIRAIARGIMGGQYEIRWKEPLRQGEAAALIANHAGAFGPIAMVVHFPLAFRPWIISEVCFHKTFRAFAAQDFFHPKGKIGRFFSHVAAAAIAPVLLGIFHAVEAIPSYFDRRCVRTFDMSIDALEAGKQVVIFPENREPFSKYNEDFSTGFVYLGKSYYRKTGKMLRFFPVYCSRKAHVIAVGEAVCYDPEAARHSRAYRNEVKNCLRDAMTRLGEETDGK